MSRSILNLRDIEADLISGGAVAEGAAAPPFLRWVSQSPAVI
jgi:hypothetical protein